MKFFRLTLLLTMIANVGTAQSDSVFARKKYNTARLAGSITLDGIPSEEAWSQVEWGGEFTQWQPAEGKPPTQPTNFKILYVEEIIGDNDLH